MKKLFVLLLLLGCLGAHAQVRSYSDNASGTFIVGLDNYFYGVSGSLQFRTGGRDFAANVSGGNVQVNGTTLSSGSGDTVIGIHDFTGDKEPELVIARRTPAGVSATVYLLSGGNWKLVGQLSAANATEMRVFRQVISARSGDVLHSWTWHGNQFDYKSSR